MAVSVPVSQVVAAHVMALALDLSVKPVSHEVSVSHVARARGRGLEVG